MKNRAWLKLGTSRNWFCWAHARISPVPRTGNEVGEIIKKLLKTVLIANQVTIELNLDSNDIKT